MRRIVFDTETTGFKPGQICQLSYIVDDGGGKAFARNHFFTVEAVEPGAERVHGFSADDLRQLSRGRVFADFAERIAGDFQGAGLVIAHNYTFDKGFLDAEFRRAGRVLLSPSWFCTMRHFTPICKFPPRRPGTDYKYPSLGELCGFLGVTEGEIAQLSEELFGIPTLSSHDARFDACATYFCYQRGQELGHIPE